MWGSFSQCAKDLSSEPKAPQAVQPRHHLVRLCFWSGQQNLQHRGRSEAGWFLRNCWLCPSRDTHLFNKTFQHLFNSSPAHCGWQLFCWCPELEPMLFEDSEGALWRCNAIADYQVKWREKWGISSLCRIMQLFSQTIRISGQRLSFGALDFWLVLFQAIFCAQNFVLSTHTWLLFRNLSKLTNLDVTTLFMVTVWKQKSQIICLKSVNRNTSLVQCWDYSCQFVLLMVHRLNAGAALVRRHLLDLQHNIITATHQHWYPFQWQLKIWFMCCAGIDWGFPEDV